MGAQLTYRVPEDDPIPGWNDLRLGQVVPFNFGTERLDGTVKQLAVDQWGAVSVTLEFDVDALPAIMMGTGERFSIDPDQ